MSGNNYHPEKRRKLYKDPDNGKICGICAGLAEYFGFEVWVVRIITISLLLLSVFSGPIILVYFVLCFILDPKPGSKRTKGCFGWEKRRHRSRFDEQPESRPYRPSVKEVWKSGSSPKATLAEIENKFSKIEKQLQRMESFVTSEQFELQREFRKMEK